MNEDEIVHPRETGALGCRKNPLRVPVDDLPAGINQERLPRRRDNQRGGAALDINPVDVEIARLRLRRWGGPVYKQDERRDQPDRPHDWLRHGRLLTDRKYGDGLSRS